MLPAARSLVTEVPVQFVQKRAQWSANTVLGREVVTLLDVILIEIQNGCIISRLKRILLKHLVAYVQMKELKAYIVIQTSSMIDSESFASKTKQWCIDCLVAWGSMSIVGLVILLLRTIIIMIMTIKSRTVMTRSKDKETEKSQIIYCVRLCSVSVIALAWHRTSLILTSKSPILALSSSSWIWNIFLEIWKVGLVWIETSRFLCSKICEHCSWTCSGWCHSHTENSRNETMVHGLPHWHYLDMKHSVAIIWFMMESLQDLDRNCQFLYWNRDSNRV